MIRKILLIFFLSGLLIFFNKNFITVNAADCADTDLSCLQNKSNELKSQANTYSSQIAVMDNQIKLTQARIYLIKGQISSLILDIDTADKKINGLVKSLDNLVKVLLNRMVTTYEIGQTQPFEILISSTNATNFFSRLNYLKIAQAHDKQLIYLTQQAKNDYSNQKNILEDKKKQVELLKTQLQTYTNQLDQQKAAKQQDLAKTQEEFARIQDQISALSRNASSSFGVTLVPHSDLADGFGRYYNQRDVDWGNNLIGFSNQTIAAVGCTLTSYAMVVAHYGGSINPAAVAANSGNFSGSSAYFLKPGPSANGHSADSIDNPSLQQLRDALNSGAVVIAGLSKDGGPYPTHYSDHWVVLRSIDGDSFRINDPGYENAMNVLLSDHYASWTIIESRIYR